MPALDLAKLRITPEVLSLFAEIDEFKGAWRALGRIAPDRLSSLRRVATIESIGSSTRIEGAKLSDREVERLLSDLRIGSFTGRDEQEVAGYAEVMETIFSASDEIPLNELAPRLWTRTTRSGSPTEAGERLIRSLAPRIEVVADDPGESLPSQPSLPDCEGARTLHVLVLLEAVVDAVLGSVFRAEVSTSILAVDLDLVLEHHLLPALGDGLAQLQSIGGSSNG